MQHFVRAALVLAACATAASAGILELVPEARKLPAPDWVKTGARLTFYVAIGSGTGRTLVRDENGKWKLKDKPGGYSIKEASNRGSGHGYAQVQIAAVDKRKVAIQARFFVLMDERMTGPPKLAGDIGMLFAPGGNEYWVHPRALQALLERAGSGGLLAGRMEFDLDGKQVAAVALKIGASSYVYDETSGVLLQSIVSAQTYADKTYKMPWGERLSGGARSTYLVRFRSLRQLALPWAGGAMPAWIARRKTMAWRGEMVMRPAGIPPVRLPVTMDLEFVEHGPAWVRYRLTQTQGNSQGGANGLPQTPSTIERIAGPGQLGGLWIAPAALARLEPGQLIDGKDPWTHMSARVARVGPVDGVPAVVIAEEGPMGRFEYVYDTRSGGLIAARVIDSAFHTETTVSLQSMR